MKKLFFTFFFCQIVFVFTNTFAQQQINVRSLTITKANHAAPTKFDLRSVDSAGQPLNYFVNEATVFIGNISFIDCAGCSSPQLFNTNIFPIRFLRKSILNRA